MANLQEEIKQLNADTSVAYAQFSHEHNYSMTVNISSHLNLVIVGTIKHS